MHPKNTRIQFQDNGTALIPLTRGEWAIVDVRDVALVIPYKWAAGGTHGRYARTRIEGEVVYMHRLIMDAGPGRIVDHINQAGYDNRRGNLRFATKLQNNVNSPAKSNNQTGYKGVRALPYGRYRAVIGIHGERRHIGVYDTPEEAAAAYDESALVLFGDFAHLNFPPDKEIA